MEYRNSGNRSITMRQSVDLPAPEGADTIYNLPGWDGKRVFPAIVVRPSCSAILFKQGKALGNGFSLNGRKDNVVTVHDDD